MKTRLELVLYRLPSMIRLGLVLASLLAMALGAGAPDDWHGGCGGH